MMLNTLRQILCGCFCTTQEDLRPQLLVNENTPLIPQIIEPSYEDALHIDRALQERLGSVVRATESKMVNIGSALPFNLHNKQRPEYHHNLSRSASMDIFGPDPYQNNQSSYGNGNGTTYQQPTPMAAPSLDYFNQRTSRSRSPSPVYGEYDEFNRRPNPNPPLLGVRLVPLDEPNNTSPPNRNGTEEEASLHRRLQIEFTTLESMVELRNPIHKPLIQQILAPPESELYSSTGPYDGEHV